MPVASPKRQHTILSLNNSNTCQGIQRNRSASENLERLEHLRQVVGDIER